LYQYVVVNDDLDSAVDAVSEIIDGKGERFKRSRNGALDARVNELMQGIQRAIDQITARK
jgi:guanylate kinase